MKIDLDLIRDLANGRFVAAEPIEYGERIELRGDGRFYQVARRENSPDQWRILGCDPPTACGLVSVKGIIGHGFMINEARVWWFHSRSGQRLLKLSHEARWRYAINDPYSGIDLDAQ